MKLELIGHTYKYALEQIMLALYPEERPEYVSVTDPLEQVRAARSTLSFGKFYADVRTVLSDGDKRSTGFARVAVCKLTDKLERDRLLQRIVKVSFYRAAVEVSGQRPVWGALTGIRPGKIAKNLLGDGYTDSKVLKTLRDVYYVSPERAALCLDVGRTAYETEKTLSPRDIALYIGVPFCPTRCAYCSFVSAGVGKTMNLTEPFCDALCREIDGVSGTVNELGLTVRAVYIGGGTPVVLSALQLERVMSALSCAFDLSQVEEYTVEAGRPDVITVEKLEVLKRCGTGRISVNPQSMSDSVLAAIGRCHSSQDVISATEDVRRVGFDAMNMDVIAGLPGDSCEGFCRTLDEVISLNPENITVHTLSRKRGSGITLGSTAVPDGSEVGQMLEYASKTLRQFGYAPYYMYRQKYTSGGFENTGWSLPGYTGLYNVLMMEELSAVTALGGGGVTKLVSRSSGRIERVFNAKYPTEYIERIEGIIDNKVRKIHNFYSMEGRDGLQITRNK